MLAGLAGLAGLRQAQAAGATGPGPGGFPAGVEPGPGGLEVTYRYDAASRLESATFRPLPGPWTTMTYSYDGGCRLTCTTDPLGSVTTCTYLTQTRPDTPEPPAPGEGEGDPPSDSARPGAG